MNALEANIIKAVKDKGAITLPDLAIMLDKGKTVTYTQVEHDFRLLVLDMVADGKLGIDANWNLVCPEKR